MVLSRRKVIGEDPLPNLSQHCLETRWHPGIVPNAGMFSWHRGTSWATCGWQVALFVQNSSFLFCPCCGFPERESTPHWLPLALACFSQWNASGHDMSRAFNTLAWFACLLCSCHLPGEEFPLVNPFSLGPRTRHTWS